MEVCYDELLEETMHMDLYRAEWTERGEREGEKRSYLLYVDLSYPISPLTNLI